MHPIKTVKEIYKSCVMKRTSDPYVSAYSIDDAIGGVTRVDYDPNKGFRLYNHSFNVGFSPKGLNRRQKTALEELAVILHYRAEENADSFDRTRVSQVRLEPKGGRPLSTKHSLDAYRQYQQQVLEKYAA